MWRKKIFKEYLKTQQAKTSLVMSEIAFVTCHQLSDVLFLVYKPTVSAALIDYRDSFNTLQPPLIS